MATNRPRYGVPAVSRADMAWAITNACLGDECTYIAKRYYIDHVPQLDIAMEMEDIFGHAVDRSTLSKKLPSITNAILEQLSTRYPRMREHITTT